MGAQREPNLPNNVTRSPERGLDRVMSQIAVVWRLVGPMLLGHPLVIALRAWIRAMARLLLAFVVAVAAYGLAMLVIVEVYPPDRPLAALLYGVGLAVATWFGHLRRRACRTAEPAAVDGEWRGGTCAGHGNWFRGRGWLSRPGAGILPVLRVASGGRRVAAIRLLSSLPLRHVAAA